MKKQGFVKSIFGVAISNVISIIGGIFLYPGSALPGYKH